MGVILDKKKIHFTKYYILVLLIKVYIYQDSLPS